MAIYHCSVKICSRGNGQSAVSAAAYRSGTDLVNEWSGIPARYSFRTCIAYSEIMLPANAPPSFSDRQTLWNSVEMNEKRGDAQLAREIEVALPKELPMEENIRLVREYCQQFVEAGMCVDLNVHDKEDGNPHCHILMTMRALDANGHWLPKSHQEFDLDENGERIRLPNGRWKSHKVFTTDWDNRDKAEQWRVFRDVGIRALERSGRSSASAREDCKVFILDTLKAGEMSATELGEKILDAGYTLSMEKRIKAQLKAERMIR